MINRNLVVGNDIIVRDQLWNTSNNKPADISSANEIESIYPINSYFYGKCTSVVLKQPRKAYEELVLGFGFLFG